MQTDSCPASSSSIASMDSIETPLDPLSPSSSGYYSPIGSDAIQTPFIEEHAGGRVYADPREPEASLFDYVGSPTSPETRRKGGYEYTSDVNSPSHKFSQSALVSPVSPRYRSYSSFSLTPDGRTCGDKNLEENPFELMFSPGLTEDSLDDPGDAPRLGDELDHPPGDPAACEAYYNYDAHMHSDKFSEGHQLNQHFVRIYALGDLLGAGGYGFVMTAHHRERGYEVAVKFIIKEKVPDGAWMVDEVLGKLPAEVLLLCFIDHENIVKCLDLYEDKIYYYMVQELHGSPWHNPKHRPAHLHPSLQPKHQSCLPQPRNNTVKKLDHSKQLAINRPEFSRRPSHDLFECIEQSEHKRLSQDQARYVFKQIVEAVYYLDVQGVSHRDLKDENVVIDRNFKAKLIDFGSAVVVDPSKPRPFYDVFFGTTAYAASEILLKRPYQAAPAEVWTLGVLLSYLLTGSSPFPRVRDAIEGTIVLCDSARQSIPPDAMELMKRCLLPDPTQRITIAEVKEHPWLKEPEN
ncbi:hypothetical protein EYR40_006468 [Pleurotus pulmonarius]|nr:hypothetical protein EYR36_011085 [Pleurotus pulmonarius]KAF4599376.1 hypothetical protein EYR40_006468 [Pleurotus pulmonarius]